MKDNIKLFDNYIDNRLSDDEKTLFDGRLREDRAFRDEYRLYLFTLLGICQEAQQENLEFGFALNALTSDQLDEIIGRKRVVESEVNAMSFAPVDEDAAFSMVDECVADNSAIDGPVFQSLSIDQPSGDHEDPIRSSVSRKELMRERLDHDMVTKERRAKLLWLRRWAIPLSSIAATILICVMTVVGIHNRDMNKVDDTIVAYNYIPDSNRGYGSLTETDIVSLEKAYKSAPADDLQAQEDTGLRLAMAYLKAHDRKRAKEVLKEMTVRFADDEEFVARCNIILDQLK